jgi:hypothetical protein
VARGSFADEVRSSKWKAQPVIFSRRRNTAPAIGFTGWTRFRNAAGDLVYGAETAQ